MNAFYSLQKPSEQILRDLIYFTNGFKLPKEAVFSQPAVRNQPPDEVDGSDTFVVASIPVSGWNRNTGDKTLYYRRLDLGQVQALPGAQIVVNAFPFAIYDILDQINAALGLQLSQNDVLNTTYQDTSAPVVLTAAPQSLVWKNSLVLPVSAPLPSAVTVPDLVGFSVH